MNPMISPIGTKRLQKDDWRARSVPDTQSLRVAIEELRSRGNPRTRCVKCAPIMYMLNLAAHGNTTRQTEWMSTTVNRLAGGARAGCQGCHIFSEGFRYSGEDFPEFVYLYRYEPVSHWGTLKVSTLTVGGEELCQFSLHEGPDFLHREIAHDARESHLVSMMNGWLDLCSKSHDCVAPKSASSWIPTRLIDLGDNCETQPRLVLREEVQSSSQADRRYLALSHCWGDSRTVSRTTEENFAQQRVGFSMSKLSNTFQDFFKITRSLGVRYAWIDSLCISIIQGSASDFQHECSQMCNVYSESYCTIAASDATDGSDGCFLHRVKKDITGARAFLNDEENVQKLSRGERVRVSGELQIFPYLPPFEKIISGPLSTRGWTLQERELSPRIIHYTNSRILWECRRCTASEDYAEFKSKSDTNGRNRASSFAPSFFRLKDEMHQGEIARNETERGRYQRWHRLIGQYSSRNLTNTSDRLLAISGLAAEFSKILPSPVYLVGLWEGSLGEGLSWYPTERKSAQCWPPTTIYAGMPSWTWASFNGAVAVFGWGRLGCCVDFKKIKCEMLMVTNKEQLDPFGFINCLRIHITAPAMFLTVSEDDWDGSLAIDQADAPLETELPWCIIGTPWRRHRDPREAGVTVLDGPRRRDFKCTKDFRPRSARKMGISPKPPKRYFLHNNKDCQIRGFLVFDTDPVSLPPTEFLCLQMGKGKRPMATFWFPNY